MPTIRRWQRKEVTKERAGITDRGGSEGRRAGQRDVRTRAGPEVRAEALRKRRDRGRARTGSEVRREILQMIGAPGESPPASGSNTRFLPLGISPNEAQWDLWPVRLSTHYGDPGGTFPCASFTSAQLGLLWWPPSRKLTLHLLTYLVRHSQGELAKALGSWLSILRETQIKFSGKNSSSLQGCYSQTRWPELHRGWGCNYLVRPPEWPTTWGPQFQSCSSLGNDLGWGTAALWVCFVIWKGEITPYICRPFVTSKLGL